MGLTSRKFSFSSLRIKTQLQASEPKYDYDIDTSPPYSPTESEMERPVLQPQLMIDLRNACAIIVNETNPPDPDEAPDHRETLRRYEEEGMAKFAARARAAVEKSRVDEKKSQASVNRAETRLSEKVQKAFARKVEMDVRKETTRKVETRMGAPRKQTSEPRNEKGKPGKEQPLKYSVRLLRGEDVPIQVLGPEGAVSYTGKESYIPRNASASYEALNGQQRPSKTSGARIEFLPPVHATIMNNTQTEQQESGHLIDLNFLSQSSSTDTKGTQDDRAKPIEPKEASVYSTVKAKQDKIGGSSEPTHTPISANVKAKLKQMERRPSEAKSASASTNVTGVKRKAIIASAQPTQTMNSVDAKGKHNEAEDLALKNIRSSLHFRPKTSAAACIDYNGPSGTSSRSTSRSNTTYETRGRPTSTAATSAALTPGEDKGYSTFVSYNGRRSVDLYNRRPSDESSRSGDDSQTKIWRKQKLAIQRAEDKYHNSGRAARPGSRASKKSKTSHRMDNDSEYERPGSRAGSIASSITTGISNYIKPRAGSDSMRSGFSSYSGLSRSGSRSSSVGSRRGNWWKGSSLRRKGSWSSFRNARPEGEESSKFKKNGGPNLNRPLPALPGLDSYKETKTHIGQLMKSGGRGRKAKMDKAAGANPCTEDPQHRYVKKDSISAPILSNDGIERTLHRYRGASIERLRPLHQPSLNNMPSESSYKSPTSQIRPRIPGNRSSQARPESPYFRSQTRQENVHSPSSLTRSESPYMGSRCQTRQEDDIYPRSNSRQDTPYQSEANKPRNDSQSITASTIKPQRQPHPMIRGPSYQKEVEAGVYPRPMDVSRDGPVYTDSLHASNVVVIESSKKSKGSEAGEGERKGGARGRLGRMFSRKDEERRVVAVT